MSAGNNEIQDRNIYNSANVLQDVSLNTEDRKIHLDFLRKKLFDAFDNTEVENEYDAISYENTINVTKIPSHTINYFENTDSSNVDIDSGIFDLDVVIAKKANEYIKSKSNKILKQNLVKIDLEREMDKNLNVVPSLNSVAFFDLVSSGFELDEDIEFVDDGIKLVEEKEMLLNKNDDSASDSTTFSKITHLHDGVDEDGKLCKELFDPKLLTNPIVYIAKLEDREILKNNSF